MARSLRLTPDERQTLSLIASAAFANPFSDARAEIDLRITGGSRDLTDAQRLELLIPAVRGRLRELESRGKAHVGGYSGDDRDLIETVFLFDTLYRFLPDFDRLIEEQEKSGDEPCPVPFARDVISRLEALGFREEECHRHLALLYQLRRAYCFIAQRLLGRSRSMKELRLRLWNNVVTHSIVRYARHLLGRMEDFSTLLLGETGAGKGAAAAAIGRSGCIPFDPKNGRFLESFTTAFVSINLSQYPEALIESELFGHRKGAFTGAVESHDGILSRCSPHGAIFLDEIGEVGVPVQIKLLQVLEDRVFHPVGSHEKRRFPGRVVAATNRSLEDLRRAGNFRDDFYYRLSSDVIRVPPLRVRIEEEPGELLDLVSHLVTKLTGQPSESLAAHVIDVIERCVPRGYAWPGNVRELEQCARQILITDRYVPQHRSPDLREEIHRELDGGRLKAHDLLAAYCAFLHERHGSHSEAARRAGLDRRTVRAYVESWTSRQERSPRRRSRKR